MKTRALGFATLVAGWLTGCHGARADDGYALDVGGDDGKSLQLAASDAARLAPLDAWIERDGVQVHVVVVGCAGACTDVEAVATGGNPPYTYAWDDGLTGAGRRICPASSTDYEVTATDTGTSGELARAPETAQASVRADVLICADAGTAADAAGSSSVCDSVSRVSPSGANPYGAWSYGWSASLGSAFTAYTEFLVSPTSYAGLEVWSSGVAGINLTPGAFDNPGATTVNDQTITAPPGQFFLHPGPIGQYAIGRWTAPRAGTFVASAIFEGLDDAPTTTDVHIQHNGVDVASGYINVDGGGNAFQTSPSVPVVAGDTIDFAVGSGGNGYLDDSTGLSAVVCPLQ